MSGRQGTGHNRGAAHWEDCYLDPRESAAQCSLGKALILRPHSVYMCYSNAFSWLHLFHFKDIKISCFCNYHHNHELFCQL